MKKLMIAAAIVCAAVVSQASSFVWGLGAGDYEGPNGERDAGLGVYADAKAFLYLGTVGASETAFDLSGATLLAEATFDSTFYSYGNIDTENLSSSDALAKIDAGQAFSIVLVDKNVSSLADFQGNYVIVNGTSGDPQAIPGATVVYYADLTDASTTVAASDWSAMGAPEPTSGLLILIGMAGLALKRRRA